jgi:hypothetical protein
VTRAVGAALAVAVVLGLAGCDAPAEPEPAPGGSTTTATSTAPGTPRPTLSAADRKRRRQMDLPDAVILEQLRRTAERIAQRTPLVTPPPVPGDIEPGTNRALGYRMLLDFGYGPEDWPALDALWTRESGWNHLAVNPRSGAYGIPQSLPAYKMAVIGDDWRTNPETQILWGLAYIAARYGTPDVAWAHSERVNWY